MRVIFLPEVYDYFKDLVEILYQEEYFGFQESAYNYVEELVDDILTTLPIRQQKPAPSHFDRYGKGMYYATFRKNKQTTWYAFFAKYNENGITFYLVRHIANNHTVAQHL